MNTFFFGLYPYVAVAVCFFVGWARFDRDQYTWKTGSSQMLANNGMRLASNLFHVGVLFILMGHVVGLLTPEAIYHHFISTQAKQLLAMISGGFFGIVCLVGLVMLVRRRMEDPRVRATSTTSDIVVLFLLLAQLILGLLTVLISTQHLDGSVMVMLANWAQYIVTFQMDKAVASIEGVNIIYKLHVFLGLTLILIAPFTRLVHVVSAPIWYLMRPYQIVRKKSAQA
ncbi:Nitrate reductase, gamma subunit [gamma proteobacterium HdN1]|nr:Nitrate reductase, gamma subunit [gamma proteobacterium HdN1]